jgi:hypothetical protein
VLGPKAIGVIYPSVMHRWKGNSKAQKDMKKTQGKGPWLRRDLSLKFMFQFYSKSAEISIFRAL